MAQTVTRFSQLKAVVNCCSHLTLTRSFHVSSSCAGKRNFRKFPTFNKRGTREHKLRQATNPHPGVPVHTYGVRPTGYVVDGQYIEVPEMIPELIVPNLQGFKLKPYVSYRTPDIKQGPFTPEDLFGAIYTPKILEDFKNGQLDAKGNPSKPNSNELLDAGSAKARLNKLSVDVI